MYQLITQCLLKTYALIPLINTLDIWRLQKAALTTISLHMGQWEPRVISLKNNESIQLVVVLKFCIILKKGLNEGTYHIMHIFSSPFSLLNNLFSVPGHEQTMNNNQTPVSLVVAVVVVEAIIIIIIIIGKGKTHPRTGHQGPEGEYRYSSTFSLTSALNGGEWSTPRPGRSTPKKESR